MTGRNDTLPDVAVFFVFLGALVVYAWTASPAMGWLDSPEFVAASACLGVPHSPGHPLPVLAGKLGTLLPIGDIPFRVNLMSALAAAGAAAALHVAARRLLALVAPALPQAARELLSATAALLMALSWSLWIQGVRAEVYALQALLLFALIAALLGHLQGRSSSLYSAALLTGLALATHHFMALTVAVPGALVVLLSGDPSRSGNRAGNRVGNHVGGLRARRITVAVLLAVLGLAAFVQLPVRAAEHPLVNWGAPFTAERLAWTVSAKAFQKAVTNQEVSTRGEDAAEILATLGEQLSWAVLLLALIGLYLGIRGPIHGARWRRPVLLLAGIAACAIAGRTLIGFDAQTPDHHGYLLPAMAALVLLAVTVPAAVLQAVHDTRGPWSMRGQRLVHVSLALLAILLVPWQIARAGRAASQRGAYASQELARWELERLPPRTLLLSAYFQTSFRLLALRAVEAARPDVAIIDRSFLTYPGAAGEARRAYPELAALIDAPLAAGQPMPVASLTDLARQRPVYAELHINLDTAIEPWLVPRGGFARILPTQPDQAARQQAERADAQIMRNLLERLGIPPNGPVSIAPGDATGIRDTLLWLDLVRLGFFCRQTWLQAARATLDHAWSLAPGDTTLIELAGRCGLAVPVSSP